ncbi:MAG: peptidoglycan editing factor PgeF [Candidatus Cloacimonetes bacterium]|nr:peptidoglycan editing factor PgeF [Candidatus Cloacimonadota bacterium]
MEKQSVDLNRFRILYRFGDQSQSLHKLLTEKKLVWNHDVFPADKIVLLNQIHSSKIITVDNQSAGKNILYTSDEQADGMITNKPELYLAIKTADCVPVFLFDEHRLVVAALHSGRKGTAENIVSKALNIMKSDFNCSLSNVKVVLGPAICRKHYQVDSVCFADFTSRSNSTQIFPFIDLRSAIKSQIKNAGVLDENIRVSEICTHENADYFSYRRNKTEERQISIIGIKGR